MNPPTNQSEVKVFALEVFDIFTILAEPEIKSSIVQKFWAYFKGKAQNKILNKPDNEILEKLLIIHKKLNSRFKDLDASIEINVMEKLNPGVKIPKVGELNRVKNLTKINKAQAEALAKELTF